VKPSAETHDEHRSALAALGVPDPDRSTLAQYLDLVAAWNARTNLTAAKSSMERVRVLVADAWRAAPLLRAGSLIDIGSGNGSPGLVLALLRNDVRVTLLEPRARRWAFLREATRHLGRPDVTVVRARSDEYAGPAAATVTIRAVGIHLSGAVPLVEPGGQVLVFGGQPEASPPLMRVESVLLEQGELHVFQRTA
jgi:16S rRNA (guanine527-N7)-methyltransferase